MGYAIVAKYHGPTDYRGSRVIATGPAIHYCGPKTRATVSWDYGVSNGTHHSEWECNARRAAEAVVAKLVNHGWNVHLAPDDYGAQLPDDNGAVFLIRYNADA